MSFKSIKEYPVIKKKYFLNYPDIFSKIDFWLPDLN